MEKFYFTFGSDEAFPYKGGWVEILAEDRGQAKEIFKAEYPNRPGSCCLNYAFNYSEEKFLKSGMLDGNRGAKCHAVHSFEEYSQICVWPATTLCDATPAEFIEYMREKFGIRTIFCEVVPTNFGRQDLFFRINGYDIGKFAIKRIPYGIRWWEDILGNGRGCEYPPEVLEKYPNTWGPLDEDDENENCEADD